MKKIYTEYKSLVQYSEVYGNKMSEKKISDLLSMKDCKKALIVVSRLSALHIAMIQNREDANCLFNILRSIYMNHIQTISGRFINLNDQQCLFCPQTLFLLEKKILLHAKSGGEDISKITIEEVLFFFDLAISINDYLPQDDIMGHELEYLYLTVYHNTFKNIKFKLGRAYFIFSKLMKEIESTEKFTIDFNKKRGYTYEEYFAVVFSNLFLNLPRFTIEGFFACNLAFEKNNFDAKLLTEKHTLIMKKIANEHKWFKCNLKYEENELWNFESFYRYPMVNIDNLVISFSETTLSYNLWEGLYWDVRYLYKQDEGLEYLREFGKPFEKYIQHIAKKTSENSNGHVKYLKEFQYKYKKQCHKSTDAYFRIDNLLIAIEAKAKSPHSDILKGYDNKKIFEETNELLIEPISQIDKRLSEIILLDYKEITQEENEFFYGIEEVIAISVSMEKIQPIGELLYFADNKLKNDIDLKLNSDLVGTYFNIDVEEYEVLCNLIEKNSDKIKELLQDWYVVGREDKFTCVPLCNYLIEKNFEYKCSSETENIISDAISEISKKIFGRDITNNQNISLN